MAKKRRTLLQRLGERILLSVLPFFAYGLIQSIRSTMRIEEVNAEILQTASTGGKEEPIIFAFWHSRLLMMPLLCRKFKRRVSILISRHRDGEIISQAVRFFPLDPVRGSTTRGAAPALREMARAVGEGSHVAITPDGPRGPRNRAQAGAILLAAGTGRPIIPVTFSASKKKVFKSWDLFLFPYPFSRGVFIWGKPIWVGSGEGRESLEEKRRTLETRLNRITDEADRFFGNRRGGGALAYLGYNLLLSLLSPLVIAYLSVKTPRASRIRRGLGERFGFLEGKCPPIGGRSVWFHAASVGEVQMTLPLIKAVRIKFPQIRPFLSTTTATGRETATKLLGNEGTVFYLPLDYPWVVRRAVCTVAPRALFIAETEIWPNLLKRCFKMGIPVALFNGRISDRSFRAYCRLAFFFRAALQGVSVFAMQSERDAERIIEIGAPANRVLVTGNLKFDRPVHMLSMEEQKDIRASFGLRPECPVVVAGSTHGGEEEFILRAFMELKQTEPALTLILAPRHMGRMDEVARILNRSGVAWVRRTRVSTGGSAQVILLDTIGELERAYAIGTVIFVGGSLAPIGGHNILEPAALGKPIIFGPHMENFREIAQVMKAEGPGIQIREEGEFVEQAKRLLKDRAYYSRLSRLASEAIQKNQGAIEKTLRVLEPFLE